MTKDFRNIGRVSGTPASAPVAAMEASPPNQRIVLLAIRAAALLFFLAGLWLLTGQPSPLPRETSSFVGIALIVSAIADLLVAKILKRIWATRNHR